MGGGVASREEDTCQTPPPTPPPTTTRTEGEDADPDIIPNQHGRSIKSIIEVLETQLPVAHLDSSTRPSTEERARQLPVTPPTANRFIHQTTITLRGPATTQLCQGNGARDGEFHYQPEIVTKSNQIPESVI